MQVYEDLNGKVALITGGSRGIGAGIAHNLAHLGVKVVLSSRKIEALDSVVEQIRKEGGQATACAAHNGSSEDLKNLVATTLNSHGQIDLLVNNAGINPIFGPTLTCDDRAWDKIMDVNLKGSFILSKLVGAHMLERGKGAIVNVASVGGIYPMQGLGVYGISKAGLIMLTKVLATEWGPGGVRVNAIAPGVIDTRLSTMLVNTPEIRQKVEEAASMKRIGDVKDVVGAVAFLLSEAAAYINGQVLVIDGGTRVFR